MTFEELRNSYKYPISPGNELNILIHEKIMGLDPDRKHHYAGDYPGICIYCGKLGPLSDYLCIKNYSTNIADAWEILEKIPMTISAYGAPIAAGEYLNKGWYEDQKYKWKAEAKLENETLYCNSISAYGLTGPHAICLAALKAVRQPH